MPPPHTRLPGYLHSCLIQTVSPRQAARISLFMRPVLALTLCAAMPLCIDAQEPNMRGFLFKDVAGEARREGQAQAVPSTKRLRRAYLDMMAGEPHNAGSPRSKTVAQYLAGLLREWGLDASVEQFEALMPYPTARQVEVLGPRHYLAELKEPVVPLDPSSGDAHQLPTYNAYSASGNVTGDVIYVNYGLPDDYDWLAKQGIDARGKIVISRYGKSWRGIKPKMAAEHGAIACLIYSDPQQDGFLKVTLTLPDPCAQPKAFSAAVFLICRYTRAIRFLRAGPRKKEHASCQSPKLKQS